MFDSNILDVMIGIVFVFLLLSVATSWFTELFALIFRFRSKDLKKYLVNWLNDGSVDQFVEKLYDSKTISALYDKTKNLDGPSFISPKDFVTGVIETALTTKGEITTDTQTEITEKLQENLPDALKFPIIAFLNDISKPIADAEAEIVDLRKSLEEWFDSAMDRCMGIYKRKVYWIGLIGAMFLAFFANIDTVAITRALWENQDLQLAVAATAVEYATTVDELDLPDNGEGDPLEQAAEALEKTQETLVEMQELELPLFWEVGDMVDDDEYNQNLGHVFSDGYLILTKFLGLAMTGLAASFGSPIWFDLLKQLVNLRSTGPKPGEETKK
jgi:hypothetical protein